MFQITYFLVSQNWTPKQVPGNMEQSGSYKVSREYVS